MRLYTGREAVRVDVGPYQHKALEHAERRVRTYGKALLGLASLLCLSVCGNLVCSALSILVFKESQFTDTIPQRPVGWIERFGDFYAHASLHVILPEDPDPPSPVPPPRPPHATKQEVENMFSWVDSGLKSCAIALSGTEACWELTDPAMTDIPEDFLQGNTDLTGTLKVGPAVKTIGAWAFAYSSLTGLDLSEATSLVDIGKEAFRGTDLESTLVIPAKVTTIGNSAFQGTKLTGLDLSKATSLVEIGEQAFYYSNRLEGTIVIPAEVTRIGPSAFAGAYDNTKLTSLDLSKATSLVEIGNGAFFATDLEGTLVVPAKVTTIGNSAFQDTKLTGLDLSKATSLVEIGKWAFYATDLTGTIEIPNTVTTIGTSAFYDTELTKATLLEEIGDSTK